MFSKQQLPKTMADVTEEFQTGDIEEVANYFGLAYQQTCEMFNTPEGKDNIANLSGALHTNYRIYNIANPNVTGELVDLIFGNRFNTDFILTLTTIFYSRWAWVELKNIKLAYTLSGSSSFRTVSNEGNVIPAAIQNTLPTQDETFKVLVNNQWLVIVMLIKLLTKLAPPPAIKATKSS